MPLQTSQDFGANFFNPTNPATRYIHSHLFPAANTGIAHLRSQPEIVKQEQDFLKGSVRVDIFGLREGGSIDGALLAPLRPVIPTLKPGQRYLLEVVVRTVRVGHPFSQGTADSNEIWVDAKVTRGVTSPAHPTPSSPAIESRSRMGGVIIGRNGGLGPHKEVDPWAHFVNVYMLDREGNRIDRRNPQDIFTPLYNHQIPPGAAQVVHYELVVPPDQREPLTLELKLQYRKFDTLYMNYVFNTNYAKGNPFTLTNELPITTIASDQLTFAVEGMPSDEWRVTGDEAKH